MARFSRTGFTSPYGKLAGRLEATRIEPEIKDLFVGACTANGVPHAEAVRDFARIVALGPDRAARMYGEGVLRVVRMVVGKNGEKPSD
jgi:hypothetical protein